MCNIDYSVIRRHKRNVAAKLSKKHDLLCGAPQKVSNGVRGAKSRHADLRRQVIHANTRAQKAHIAKSSSVVVRMFENLLHGLLVGGKVLTVETAISAASV